MNKQTNFKKIPSSVVHPLIFASTIAVCALHAHSCLLFPPIPCSNNLHSVWKLTSSINCYENRHHLLSSPSCKVIFVVKIEVENALDDK